MEETKIVRPQDEPFVHDPVAGHWLRPWDAAQRLKMPGLPCRWDGPHGHHTGPRTYTLTTREGGGVARWVRFEVSPEGAWTIQETRDIMWATNYGELRLYGRRLEGYNPKRRKEPARKFPGNLLWQVHEIGLKEALVSLPEQSDATYVVPRSKIRFCEAEPTPLELRLQEIEQLGNLRDLTAQHPLALAGWIREVGNRERPLIGYGGRQVYRHRAFEDWEERRQRWGLSVDEALLAIRAALNQIDPDNGGPDGDPEHFASVEKLERWWKGHWSESDAEALRQMAQLAYMEDALINAAMRSIEAFREFLSLGGSATLPAPAGR